MAYFTYFYFEGVRRAWLAELTFTIAFILILLFFYQGALGLIPGSGLGRLSSLQVRPSPLPDTIRNQRILIIGEDLSAYRYNQLATPYLNWDLSKYDLKNLDNYEAVINIFDHFRKDPPDYILDRENVVEKLFQRAPALASQYEKTDITDVYKKK